MPCQLRLFLRYRRKKGGKVVDGVYLVFLDNFQELGTVADIGLGCRTALKENAFWFSSLDVTGDYIAFRNHSSDFHCQLGTDLSG